MAFTGNFLCTSFKVELLKGVHDFSAAGGDTFKIALYTDAASFTAATTAYTASNEVSGAGYSAGGGTLTNIEPTSSGTTAFLDFADFTFSAATITARGALIYNDTVVGKPSIAVLDFGSDKISTVTFTITMPANTATAALIRSSN